jgi:hypothetical protein
MSTVFLKGSFLFAFGKYGPKEILPGIEPGPPAGRGEHFSKELFEDSINSDSEHLHEPAIVFLKCFAN